MDKEMLFVRRPPGTGLTCHFLINSCRSQSEVSSPALDPHHWDRRDSALGNQHGSYGKQAGSSSATSESVPRLPIGAFQKYDPKMRDDLDLLRVQSPSLTVSLPQYPLEDNQVTLQTQHQGILSGHSSPYAEMSPKRSALRVSSHLQPVTTSQRILPQILTHSPESAHNHVAFQELPDVNDGTKNQTDRAHRRDVRGVLIPEWVPDRAPPIGMQMKTLSKTSACRQDRTKTEQYVHADRYASYSES